MRKIKNEDGRGDLEAVLYANKRQDKKILIGKCFTDEDAKAPGLCHGILHALHVKHVHTFALGVLLARHVYH